MIRLIFCEKDNFGRADVRYGRSVRVRAVWKRDFEERLKDCLQIPLDLVLKFRISKEHGIAVERLGIFTMSVFANGVERGA
jgi:hypothetical protein